MDPSRGSTAGHIISGLCSAVIFTAIAIYGYSNLHFGVDLTVEGYYAAAPQRLALGDQPLHDDFTLAGRSFDVLVWPLFIAHPSVTLLQLRTVGFALQMAVVLLLFIVLRRFAPAYIVAASLAVVALVGSHGVWTPGYTALAVHAFTLAALFWVLACLSTGAGRYVWPIAASVCAGLGTIAYMPLAAVMIVPLVTALGSLFSAPRRKRFLLPTLLYGMVYVALIGGAAVLAYRFELADNWQAAIAAITQASVETGRQRLLTAARDMGALVPYLFAVAGLVLAMGLLPPKRRGFMAALQGLAIILIATALLWWVSQSTDFRVALAAGHRGLLCVIAAAAGLALASLAARPRGMSANDPYWDGWGYVQWALFGTGTIAFAVLTILSSAGLVAAGIVALIVFPVAVVGLSRNLFSPRLAPEGSHAQRLLPRLATLALCAVFAVMYLPETQAQPFGDQPRVQLTEIIQDGPLHNIRTTPERARVIRRIADELRTRGVQPGDYLLAYDDCPGLYFITQTRPAVPFTWMRQSFAPAARQQALDSMMRRGRIPEFCVRAITHPRDWGSETASERMTYIANPTDPCFHPIDEYVTAHYGRVVATPDFEIWRRREAGSMDTPVRPASSPDDLAL